MHADFAVERKPAREDIFPSQLSPSPSPSPSELPYQVLVAEDNPVNRELVQTMLELIGFRVDAVVNGREAVNAFNHKRYDLILMDCQMPELDGYDAVRLIREQEEAVASGVHTPIVALTAHAMPSDRDRCLSAGMDGYISKPFRLERLREVMDRWLRPNEVNDVGAQVAAVAGRAHSASPAADSDFIREQAESLDDNALNAIRSLERQGAADMLNKVVELYFHRTPLLLRELRQAASRDDAAALRLAAHSLKSSSANLGASHRGPRAALRHGQAPRPESPRRRRQLPRAHESCRRAARLGLLTRAASAGRVECHRAIAVS
jgi:CheY-like chemotaxis protein